MKGVDDNGSVHVVKFVWSVNSDGDDGLGGNSNGYNNALFSYKLVSKYKIQTCAFIYFHMNEPVHGHTHNWTNH